MLFKYLAILFIFCFLTQQINAKHWFQTLEINDVEEKSQEKSTNTTKQIEECSNEALVKEKEEILAERNARFTIACGTFSLFTGFMCGYFLEHKHILWFPAAGAGVIIGLIVGALMHLFSGAKDIAMTRFDTDFFFVFLLPPIIFEAGYNMKRQAFFRNFVAICLYAFIGTTVSCFIVGGLVYGFGKLGWCYPLGGLASLTFGALISATDPVTVLAVFQALHADLDLYSLVFGESVLNDAVAIVLYRTLINFRCDVTVSAVFVGFGSFLLIFLGSTFVGIAVSLISALISKHTAMQEHQDYLFIETCILCLYPYFSFMLAEAYGLSGIVSILFCGIGMAHYTYNNLSEQCQTLSRQLFKVLATIPESFVFTYLGMAMFTFDHTFSIYNLIILSFIAILIARVFNIFPISLLVNMIRDPNSKPGKISFPYQFLLWFSGLRGAVAFVLAVSSYNDQTFAAINDPKHPTVSESDAILTTTLFIAVISVFAMGGPIAYLLRHFNALEANTEEEVAAYTATGLMGRDKSRPMAAKGPIYYDRRYIKPFFTKYQFRETDGCEEIRDDVNEVNVKIDEQIPDQPNDNITTGLIPTSE